MIKLGSIVLALVVASPAAAEVRVKHGRCGTPQIAPQIPQVSLFAAGEQRVIWLNRYGGTYEISNAATDSSKNVVNSGIAQRGNGPMVIPPLEAGFDWGVVSSCVRDAYKRFNIRVVESRPTSGSYVEAVVGGYGTELGFGMDELFGIASADNFCNITEKGIAFSFSQTHQQVPDKNKELCATIAHEVGHLLALEHEVLDIDMMSYVLVSDSASKAFVDQQSQCGVGPGQTNPCSCNNTGGTPNSGKRLGEFLMSRPSDTSGPTLSVQSPGNNSNVGPSFEVVAKASDAEGMADVRAILDGVEIGNASAPTGDAYHIPGKGAEGQHSLEVIARDTAGNEKSQTLAITIKKLDLGEDCVANDACSSGQCAFTADGNFCTQSCDPGNDTCPSDFSCDATAMVCFPGGGGGGCCSVSDDRTGAIAMLLALGVGGILLRRRR